MSLKWKELFVGLLDRAEEPHPETGETGLSKTPYPLNGDEEALTDELPYKLEPSLAEAEQYLDRIRRQGL